jgi:hypothetical protein
VTNPQNRNTLEKVYQEVDSIVPDEYGCKPWPRVNGMFPRVMINGMSFRVHRLVLERKLGRTLRPGYFALHTCDYSICVNEDHLYEGTQADNGRDRSERNPDSWTDRATGDRSGIRRHPESFPRDPITGRLMKKK